jgi:hypothetical protein
MSTKKEPIDVVATAVITLKPFSVTATSTTLPPEVVSLPKEKRDNEIVDLFLRDNPDLKEFRGDLPGVIDTVIDNDKDSLLQKGRQVVIIYKPEIKGNLVVGRIDSIESSYVEQWNDVKEIINIDELKEELKLIIKKLAEENEFEKIKNISDALDKLNQNNGAAALKFIKSAGSLIYKVGLDLGAKILTDILYRLM